MRRLAAAVCVLLILATGLSGCGERTGLDPKHPVTLTLWHNFGGTMQTTMDELVDTFNATVGRERGILLSVTSISGSASVQEKLTMIAAGDPGAPEMPDLSVCYPSTAVLLKEKGLLASLDGQFTAEELDAYLPRFVEEGRLSDGQLFVFPFAKSTEVLFVNQTLFNRFSAATGVTLESLSTFEGLSAACLRYYEWTDGLTPDVPGDGQWFYTADSLFNLAQVGMEQLGTTLFDGEALRLDDPAYRRVWDVIARPAVMGGYAVYDGYSSDLSKTGKIICSTGSTAGITFYGDQITYDDNTTEPVEYTVLPFPTFDQGEKIAIQRGNGMVVARSTPEKEEAAALVLKGFTAPEQNMKFVSSTGYLPVTKDAFENSVEAEIAANDNPNIQKLLRTAVKVYEEYNFYIPPVFDRFNALSGGYEEERLSALSGARSRYLELAETMAPEEAYDAAMEGVFEAFVSR